MIRENHRIKQTDTVLKLGIPEQRVGHITNLPGFWKVCAGGVSGELLGHFEGEGEGLLWQIVTSDKTWVHYYDSENSLWNTTIKDHQHKRNKKLKPLLEKSCGLRSGTLKVLCSAPWKKMLQWLRVLYWNPKKSQKMHHKEGGSNSWCLVSTR